MNDIKIKFEFPLFWHDELNAKYSRPKRLSQIQIITDQSGTHICEINIVHLKRYTRRGRTGMDERTKDIVINIWKE